MAATRSFLLSRVVLAAGLLVATALPAHAILPLCRPVSTSGSVAAKPAMRLYAKSLHAAAFHKLAALADRGNLYAQNQLGIMYNRGLGVPRDYTMAVSWWQRAADQGQVTAQCNLGIMYMYGQGVKQDDVMAYVYLNAAAARGSRDARRKRDLLEAWRLTPSELKRAQSLSGNWSADQ